MKIYELSKMAAQSGGEYILGMKDLGTHACYLICGTLAPGEGGRVIEPGRGHEEILMAVDGDIELQGAHSGLLKMGCAIHIIGEARYTLLNPGNVPVSYIAAGGHSDSGH